MDAQFPLKKSPSLSRRNLLAGAGVAAGASALAACSPDDGGGDGGGKATSTMAPMTLPPEKTGITYPEGYVGPRARDLKPFSDGSKTFKVVVQQDPATVGDWATNKTTEYIEKVTGLKVEFQAVLTQGADGGVDMTKINAMLAGGDLPDAFMGIPFTNAQISLYGQQGIFKPLDDLIKTYAPATNAMMADYPDIRSLKASTDGKLYTMLGINDCYHCRSSPGRAWISKSYLEKVGMEIPTTTEEFRAVLQAFKDKNPSGQSGFIPFAASANNPIDNWMMGAFGYAAPNTASAPWLRLADGKVQLPANQDDWRKMLIFLNQLGKDGTLTKSAFTMTREELAQAGNKKQLGFVRAYWWGSFFNPVELDKDAPWRDYVAVPPVKGPDGVQIASWDYYGYATNGLQITKNCQNPELLVQWSDYQLDLENIMWEYAGVKDSNWFYADAGNKGINGKSALFRNKVWPAPAGESWNQYATMYRSIDFRHSEEVNPDAPTFEAGLFQAGEAYEKYAEKKEQQLPPVIIPDADAATVADTQVAITQHVTQHMAKFSLGELDPNKDGDWKTYTDAFNTLNLQAYLDIYQKAYDNRPK